MTCCIKGVKDDDESQHFFKQKASKPGYGSAKDLQDMFFDTSSSTKNLTKTTYVRYLEKQYESLQSAYFNLSTEMVRLQSYVRQLIRAAPDERNKIIKDLKHNTLQEIGAVSQRYKVFPTLEQLNGKMGDIKKKQHFLVHRLRQQIGSFEKASQRLPREGWLSKEKENTSPGLPANSPDNIPVITSLSESRNSECSGNSFMNKSMESCATCNTLEGSVISTRSSAFKELRDMYQKSLMPALKNAH